MDKSEYEFKLGVSYLNGDDVEKNEYKAFIQFVKAAGMGNSQGMFNVAQCYYKGIGVEKNEKNAFEYYQRSSEMDYSDGIYMVGYCYFNGIGVEKDEHKAFEYYKKSAVMENANGTNNVGKMGHASGTKNVGDCYYYGIGVQKDEHKAFIYCQKSAEMGEATEKDEHKAFIYYKKSAEMGYVKGTVNIGTCYRNGIGVEKNEHKAFIYYQKSAEMGDSDGTYAVGTCYEYGIGVEKNEHKAFVYFQKSAEMGDTYGMFKVGNCYRNGIGVTRDIEKAESWEKRANLLKPTIDEHIHKNLEIDNKFKKVLIDYQIPWIPYNELKDIVEIGKGGFATVYLARWLNKSQSMVQVVALKTLHDSNYEEFIKELKAYCEIGHENPTFLKCLEYAQMGSLRKNLYAVSQMKLEKKLTILCCIAFDLHIIHSKKIIHRDLHSGNILLNSLHSAYIIDLGLSTLTNIGPDKNQVYGVIQYIAPEVLLDGGKAYSMASDVYSFGIIACEIVSGLLAYQGIPCDIRLQHEICEGKRPIIPTYVPKLIAELINKCLSSQPKERPTSKNIYETINICIKCLSSQPEEKPTSKEIYEIINIWSNKILNTEPTEFIVQVERADEMTFNNLESKLSKSEEIYVSERHTPLNVINFNKSNCIGKGTEKDEKKAFEYCKKAADMNDEDGIINTGYFYENGVGVEKDERKAFIYNQKSAEMGHVKGTINIGTCYRNGIGVEKNEHKAFIYYQKSAEMGDARGTYNVGNCYRHGIGVEKDEHKAFLYFKKSAEMGHDVSMSTVGYFYRNGIGIQMDMEKANYWLLEERKKFHELFKTGYKHINIDKNIKPILDNERYQLSWIPYHYFKVIENIGKDGFATTYLAKWIREYQQNNNIDVIASEFFIVLKEIHGDNYLTELKNYCEIGIENPSFMKCYGISRNNIGNYILVIKHAVKGSLSQNLSKIKELNWKDKLDLLLSIAYDLKAIHSQEIVHRDLHSGNILQDSLSSAYISDLGLSIQYMKQNDGHVYGILPFIAPEVLNKKSYIPESDIYSFGIVMWKILHGMLVTIFYSLENQNKIEEQIREIVINNLRPPVNKIDSNRYIDLMKKCWHQDPKVRPMAKELCEIFKEWSDNNEVLNELENSNQKLECIERSYERSNSISTFSKLID
ncbi:kinase-like domain-containing protein [Gigaspora rosea]|uniref:Kinase-like domain-containing protein n=1 Tax=Gigaspora rosea TaxID=44941 RepID=A0A397VVE6_9GLOM|nr:kinase-like domain-containing protein [Gigaspora rosea]